MKAIVYTEYGPPEVLKLQEVAQPIPQDDEILVKNYATTINFGDLIARDFKRVTPREFNMPFLFLVFARLSFGLNKPKNQILGSEFAGEVAAIGKNVTHFKVGDAVFGYNGQNMQANAEYLCIAANGPVTLKPSNLSYEEAAALPYGTITALNLLRKADIQPGQKVLINGASGSIGSAAVQLAKHYGAEVTGVCGTPRLAFVKALGADKVIDYTKEDFTQNGERYDLIFDILGRSSFAKCKKSLNPHGRYLLASFKSKQLIQMLWTSLVGDKKVICALSNENGDELPQIKALVEAGKITAHIDKCFPLEKTAEAHRYVEQGHKQGHIIIRITQPANS
ncbi:MAG: NAD(P)-dependent alcohol dehydrogenase [Anaerolineales bacterium]|nr:NAD(P)-dependent alcohol dehydrogenase [Anaerolineales bacterium]